MVINWTKVYNILGFFRSTNTLFEKMALKDFVFLCIFSLATGPLELAKLPEFSMVINWTKVYNILRFFRSTNTFYLGKCQVFLITPASFTPG